MEGTRNARKESLGGPMARYQGDCDSRRKRVGNMVSLVLGLQKNLSMVNSTGSTENIKIKYKSACT